MANQYTGIKKSKDYATLYAIEQRRTAMLEEYVADLVQALTRKYTEQPDKETRRLLVMHGVDVWSIDDGANTETP